MIIVSERAVRLTHNQRALVDAANAQLESGQWEQLPDRYFIKLRWTQELPTPDYISRGDKFGQWHSDTYTRLVFLDILPASGRWTLLLSYRSAPWHREIGSWAATRSMKRTSVRPGKRITYAKAMEILETPALAVWGC